MLNQPSNNPVGGTFDKIDAIAGAYSQLRISGLTVQPTPEDLELALDRLESMAAEWFERNICADYNFEDQPDPNSPSGVKRGFKQAFETNLAVRLIPDFNKPVPEQLMRQANQSLSNLSGRSAVSRLQKTAYPARMARGSGNTRGAMRWQRFYRQSQPSQDCRVNHIFVDDVSDYVEHFEAYLNDEETIVSAVVSVDAGLNLDSDSVVGSDVIFRIVATAPGDNRRVTIIVTTSEGRKQTRIVLFNAAKVD